jgi:hypothetical protein
MAQGVLMRHIPHTCNNTIFRCPPPLAQPLLILNTRSARLCMHARTHAPYPYRTQRGVRNQLTTLDNLLGLTQPSVELRISLQLRAECSTQLTGMSRKWGRAQRKRCVMSVRRPTVCKQSSQRWTTVANIRSCRLYRLALSIVGETSSNTVIQPCPGL